jgi:hypothetical protein
VPTVLLSLWRTLSVQSYDWSTFIIPVIGVFRENQLSFLITDWKGAAAFAGLLERSDEWTKKCTATMKINVI